MKLRELDIYCITDKGLIRDENQDRITFGFLPVYGYIFAVADGLGGYSGGSIASRSALRNIIRYLKYKKPNARNFREAIYYANAQIVKKAKENEKLKDMGTTICLASLRGTRLTILNAGDSRAYLYKDDKLIQLSRDHSTVGSLVEKGYMTREEARLSTNRNEIYSSLGLENEKLVISENNCEFVRGDILLLCSDGFSNYFSDEELAEFLSRGTNLELLGDHLYRQVCKRGAEDNVSFIIVANTRGKENGSE